MFKNIYIYYSIKKAFVIIIHLQCYIYFKTYLNFEWLIKGIIMSKYLIICVWTITEVEVWIPQTWSIKVERYQSHILEMAFSCFLHILNHIWIPGAFFVVRSYAIWYTIKNGTFWVDASRLCVLDLVIY